MFESILDFCVYEFEVRFSKKVHKITQFKTEHPSSVDKELTKLFNLKHHTCLPVEPAPVKAMRHLVVDNSHSLTKESIPEDKTYFPEKLNNTQ